MAENKSSKRRFPVYLPPGRDEKIAQFVDSGYAKSQNDFINRAIDFYIGYLLQKENADYLSPMLASVIKNEIENTEKGICEILFKMAVELAKANILTANLNDFAGVSWSRLDDLAKAWVQYNNGIVSLRDAEEISLD